MDVRGPAGGILVIFHAEESRRIVDADAGGGLLPFLRIPDRDAGGVLFDGVVLAQSHVEGVDREDITGLSHLHGISGQAVDRILLLRGLAEAKAQDEQQDPQMADPGAPDPRPVLHREEALLRFPDPAEAQCAEESLRILHAPDADRAFLSEGGGGIALTLLLFQDRGDPHQIAEDQIHAQKCGQQHEPPGVEYVVQLQGHDGPRRSLSVQLRVRVVGLSLGNKASQRADRGQNDQKADGELHGTDKIPDLPNY